MSAWSLIFEVVVLLAAALVLGGLCARLRQSPLIGYLFAGMLLGGPGSLGLVSSADHIEAIAELGVSLLLFGLGLEFSLRRLKKLGGKALGGGALQVVVTLAVAALVAKPFGLSWPVALAVGAMVCLSSTAVVLRLLMERSEIETPHGRLAVAVLLVQDMSVVPLAIFMGLLAGGSSAMDVALDVGRILGLAALFVAGLYILLNKVAVAVLGTLTLERNRELATILAVTVGLGSTWAAHAIGLSPALGAFVAGILLGSAPFATQIRADVSSLRVVLLTLFFGAAGMVANPIWMLKNLHIVAGLLVILTLGKVVVIWLIFRRLGIRSHVAAATGFTLGQVGEFAFVLGKIGKDNGVLDETTHLTLVSVTILSLLAAPQLVSRATPLGQLWARLFGGDAKTPVEESEALYRPDVLIVGFGPAGERAGRAYEGRDDRVLVLDLNEEGLHKARECGFRGEIGDATHMDVLEHAHVECVHTAIITVPHHATAMTVLCHVRRLAPTAHVAIRSRYARHTHEFVDAGAHAVFDDEEEIGDRIADHLRTRLPDEPDGDDS